MKNHWKTIIISSISLLLSVSCASNDPKDTSDAKNQDSKANSRNVSMDDPEKSGKKFGCIEGNCVNGVGKYVYENGDIYTGSFKNDLRDGSGSFVYADGEKFNGTYAEDKKQGPGEYNFKNGDKYVGEFQNGQINGKGTYSFKDGKSVSGDFTSDGQEGIGVLTDDGKSRNCKITGRKLLCE
ncbi:MORN repeat-containing protein [Leptospira sp. WS39.C2]